MEIAPFLSLLQEMKGCSIHECRSQETPNYSTCGKQITICFNSTPDNQYHFNVKTPRASFFIMLFFTSWNRANPSSNLFRRDHHLHLQVEKLWQKLCQVVTEQGRGKSRNVSWLGAPFPSPHPGALGLLHIQLVVSSLEVGHNSNKIAEKAKFAFCRWYFDLYRKPQFSWVW